MDGLKFTNYTRDYFKDEYQSSVELIPRDDDYQDFHLILSDCCGFIFNRDQIKQIIDYLQDTLDQTQNKNI